MDKHVTRLGFSRGVFFEKSNKMINLKIDGLYLPKSMIKLKKKKNYLRLRHA